MNDQELKASLHRVLEIPGQTGFCPEDQDIAEYFDGSITDEKRGPLHRHVANCRYCQSRLGLISRLQTDSSETEVAGSLLAKAKQMAGEQGRRRWNHAQARTAARWASAAMIILAIGFLTRQAQEPTLVPLGGPNDQTTWEFRETRSIDYSAVSPAIEVPADQFKIEPGNGAFNWTPVPGSLYYQLQIVSDEGDLVARARIVGTSWKLPPDLELVPGAEYFVRVEAQLDEYTNLKSDFVPFTIGKAP